MSSQKQWCRPLEVQHHRCFLPSCPGSHSLRVRLLKPSQGGLAALPPGREESSVPQLSHQLYWQDRSTWPQDEPLYGSCSSSQGTTHVGNPANCCLPYFCSPPEGMARSPLLPLVGWSRVLGCGQVRGKPWGQASRDIRLMQCDTSIWTKHPKHSV